MLVLIPTFSHKDDKLIVHDYTTIRVKHSIRQYLLCDTYVKKTSLSSKKQLSFLYGYCICSTADRKFINYMKNLPRLLPFLLCMDRLMFFKLTW